MHFVNHETCFLSRYRRFIFFVHYRLLVSVKGILDIHFCLKSPVLMPCVCLHLSSIVVTGHCIPAKTASEKLFNCLSGKQVGKHII